MKILYGTNEYKIDVTAVALEKCLHNNELIIPSGDLARSDLFTDPTCGVTKCIFIEDDSNNFDNNFVEYGDNGDIILQANEVSCIKYGTRDYSIDVTEAAFQKCVNNNILTIPSGDFARADRFTDPVYGVTKSIFIRFSSLQVYPENTSVNKHLNFTQIIQNTGGRFCNHFIRNIAVSFVAKKHNLFVRYSYLEEMKRLGVGLFSGLNIYKDTIDLIEEDPNFGYSSPNNYFDILNRDTLHYNLDPNKVYFQTKELISKIFTYLQNENKEHIMQENKFRHRYNNNNDCFIHIRLTDAAHLNPGLEYYYKVLSQISFENIYIASDDNDHDIIKSIVSKYSNTHIINFDLVETIQFGSTNKHVILSHGSFSATIGFLSFFSNVYYCEYGVRWYGDMFSIPQWNMIRK